MSSLPGSSGGIAVAITLVILITIGLAAITLTVLSRQQQERQDCENSEESIEIRESEVTQAHPISPSLPVFKTRSSLSISSRALPRSPTSRSPIAAFRPHGQRAGSIDAFPSVESVLEKYEREEQQGRKHENDGEEVPMLEEEELGEPGPAVALEELNRSNVLPQQQGKLLDPEHPHR